MTDAQNYPMPTESKEVLNSNLPPPYPHGETQVDSMPPYMPPPYSAAPAMYPPSPYPPVLYPPQAGVDMGTLPPGECNPLGEPEADAALLVSSFDDKTIRKAFIRKVFSVVTLQLLVTFSIVCVFTFSSVVRAAVQSNIWIYLSSYILFAVVAISLSYSNSFSRSHPWNLVGLSVVTLTLSYLVGTVASFHDTTAVVIAMGATVAISFTIIIFSAQTRVDFTICNGILLVLAVDLLMFSFFCSFFYSNVLQIVYGSLGALLFSLFLAIDCQLVMGRQKYALDPEEYVFAALILYLDIINIFLYLLIIMGGSSK
ncbi:protein lifeguard 1 isoform X2 [Salmo salar]|uniref:Protein lifeguard 1 isoform X2 n=1 Tax=Salmo salar TaxID=8030 RepID=A0A1S3LZA4_SALSA|nr:protein lifeguard 1 isoform X2 [Salmo salar]|eukprot:XP_013996242.1 PREDICTED: protein lifeguard 1-like isoform X2 [Salmo salar]